MSEIIFEVFSGGTVRIDTTRCPACTSKACVAACRDRYIDGPLELAGERPALRFSLAEIKKGLCSECLGCELACQAHGLDVVRIELPTPELDAYLSQPGPTPAFRRPYREHLD